jgi:hypothetical protein
MQTMLSTKVLPKPILLIRNNPSLRGTISHEKNTCLGSRLANALESWNEKRESGNGKLVGNWEYRLLHHIIVYGVLNTDFVGFTKYASLVLNLHGLPKIPQTSLSHTISPRINTVFYIRNVFNTFQHVR